MSQYSCPASLAADEIDAIGKARNAAGSDSGTAEREQGLLQLLCEMDGFRRRDKVLLAPSLLKKRAAHQPMTHASCVLRGCVM